MKLGMAINPFDGLFINNATNTDGYTWVESFGVAAGERAYPVRPELLGKSGLSL